MSLAEAEYQIIRQLHDVISAKASIRRVLRVCQDWIESVAGEVVRTKQLLYQSLSPVIQTTLAIFSIYISQTGTLSPCTSLRQVYLHVKQVHLHLHQSDRYASIYISQTGTAPFASIRQVHLLLQQSDRSTAIYVSQTGTSPYVSIRQVHLRIRKISQKGSDDFKLIWHIKSAKGSELRSRVKEGWMSWAPHL